MPTKKNQPNSQNVTGAPRVLFFMPYGEWTAHNTFDLVFSRALQLAGADCIAVGCDGIFQQNCQVLAHSKNAKSDCANCARTGAAHRELFGLKSEQLSDLITADDLAKADTYMKSLPSGVLSSVEWEGVRVGEFSTLAVCNYFKVSPSSLSAEPYHSVHASYCRAAFLVYRAMERLCDRIKPTHAVVLNGTHYLYGAAFAALRARNIPTIVHESTRFEDAYRVSLNETFSSFKPAAELIRRWADTALLTSELDELKRLVFPVKTGPSLTEEPHSMAEGVRNELNIPVNAKVLGFLSSSEYELAFNADEYERGPKQIEVLTRVIEEFRGRLEYLVIRHDPFIGGSNATRSTRPDYELQSKLLELARSAPANVRVVMPNESLEAERLFWALDACIAPCGYAGTQAMMCGLPTAMLSASPLSAASKYCINDISEQGMTSLVDDLFAHTGASSEELRTTYRTVYAACSRVGLRFQSFKNSKDGHTRANLEELATAKSFGDPELERLVKFMKAGGDFYASADSANPARSAAAEEGWLKAEVERIESRRAESRDLELSTVMATMPVAIVRVHAGPRLSAVSHFAEWYNHSRYKAEQVSAETLTISSDKESLKSLAAAIGGCTSPFVMLAEEAAYYDEGILGAATSLLAENPRLEAVLWGAWVGSPSLNAQDAVFSDKRPISSANVLRNHVLSKSQTLWPLTLLVAKREWLLKLVDQLMTVDPATTAERLVATLAKPDVAHQLNPRVFLVDGTANNGVVAEASAKPVTTSGQASAGAAKGGKGSSSTSVP